LAKRGVIQLGEESIGRKPRRVWRAGSGYFGGASQREFSF
jgi:hypothetical protein